MKIRILWVGKTKERYLREGIDYYLKLLQNQIRITTVEVKDVRGSDKEKIISEESRRLLSQTKSYILLDEKGVEMNSREFAAFLLREDLIDFVIGGHLGVSDEIKNKAQAVISLSKMTFTHEMARLILLEQIYRSLTIIKGKDYHH